jgi:hypothetical protein
MQIETEAFALQLARFAVRSPVKHLPKDVQYDIAQWMSN